MLEFLIAHRYFALFLYVFIEEAGIPLPVPGDISILAVSTLQNVSYLGVVFFVVTSTLFGSSILYYVSKQFGRPFLDKFGPKIRVTPERVERIQRWMNKYGGVAIILGRLTPGLRTVTTIAAGTFEVPFKTFFIFTGIAAWIWATVYFTIGKIFGRNYKEIINFLPHEFPINTFSLAIILIAVFIVLRRKNIRKDFILRPKAAIGFLRERPILITLIVILVLLLLFASFL